MLPILESIGKLVVDPHLIYSVNLLIMREYILKLKGHTLYMLYSTYIHFDDIELALKDLA